MTACASHQNCDTIYTNAIVHTMDERLSIAEAFAVMDGKIIAIGTAEEITGQWVASRVIDLEGKDVFPGFIDAHAHLFGLGEESVTVQLLGSTSIEDVKDLLGTRAASVESGSWIRGRGWDQNDWPVAQFPNKKDLDAVTTRHPVFLSRIDGHAGWVNSLTLDMCGITRETPDPEGGRILRDAQGEPTGILLDNAMELVRSHIPPPDAEQLRQAYQAAVQQCLATGMTGMHDMGMNREQIEAVTSLIEEDLFPFRMVGYIDGRGDTWESNLSRGRQTFGNQQLTIAGLKLYADGALGSRGAYLLEAYHDDPENRGIPIVARDSIRYESERALQAGMQVCVHAIGDAAVRTVLDAYESALASDRSAATLPLRIEHAQVIAREDIPRFAALGVVPSMQPTHCTSDMYWAESRLGAERIRGAYAWKELIRGGSYVPGGSDFPVERPDPLPGIYAAAFRQDADGRPASAEDITAAFSIDETAPDRVERWENGWYAEQAMSRDEAVRAFTSWAAAAAGMEQTMGSLEQGKWADFVVLSDNIMTIPREHFLQTRIIATYVSGKKVFDGE